MAGLPGLKYKRPDHSEIKYKNMRFLITDRPNDDTVNKYIDELNKYSAAVVVRVCDPSYDKDKLEESGIKLNEELANQTQLTNSFKLDVSCEYCRAQHTKH